MYIETFLSPFLARLYLSTPKRVIFSLSDANFLSIRNPTVRWETFVLIEFGFQFFHNINFDYVLVSLSQCLRPSPPKEISNLKMSSNKCAQFALIVLL